MKTKKNYIVPFTEVDLVDESLIIALSDDDQEVSLGLDLDEIEDDGYAD